MTLLTLIPPIYTNVLQYGAVGDGVTDDTGSITAALAAIPTSTGGVLYFPPGYTYLTSGFDISAYAGNLIILGGGWSSVLKLKNGANSYIISSVSGAQQGTRISNIMLDCNSANQTSASGGINLYKPRRCLIDFVYVLNPWQTGIFLQGTGGDFGYQNRIANNFIIGGSNVTTGTNAYGNGLRMTYVDENHIYANHFEANGNFTDATYGCHIYDQNGLNSFFGNSFVNGYGVLKLDGLQNRIFGNVFDGNGRYSVQCNGSASGTLITNNTMLNVGYRASGGSANSIDGIYLNATQCLVANNWFQAAGGGFAYTRSFVNVDTGATYSTVKDNEFNVQSTSGTVTPIYYPGATPAGLRVRGNNGYDNVASKQIWVTENHGSATITSGTTSIAVTHGLAQTPLLEQIMVTPQTTLNSAHFWWISGATSTQFVINLDQNPGANVVFGWQANIGF